MTVRVEWYAIVRIGREETRDDALARAIERHGKALVDVRSALSWRESEEEAAVGARNARLRAAANDLPVLDPEDDEEDG